MARPTLDEIFSEPDEFGLLEVTLRPLPTPTGGDRGLAIMHDISAFYERHGRFPNADAADHEEMRLGTIWETVRASPTEEMRQADHLDLLNVNEASAQTSWRDDPAADAIPKSLDDIFDDDDLEVAPDVVNLRHVTPAAARHTPDHRAEFVPCKNFDQFASKFEALHAALESGERRAIPVRKWAVIEPLEGDFFIRGGLLALIAEKSEMTARGGARDHRLRVIFSNGTESDPLMSSFRKSLNDDKTARMVERLGLGPLDPEWEADRLELSGTIYVARSLSKDPAIESQRAILHKIGVTSQDVRRRVADARNDPTFLLAPVEIVATYELKNLPRNKVEDLLHRFFAPARPAELYVVDRFGKKIRPKEWFYVLPEHIGQAADLIRSGQLHAFRYDPESQRIQKK